MLCWGTGFTVLIWIEIWQIMFVLWYCSFCIVTLYLLGRLNQWPCSVCAATSCNPLHLYSECPRRVTFGPPNTLYDDFFENCPKIVFESSKEKSWCTERNAKNLRSLQCTVSDKIKKNLKKITLFRQNAKYGHLWRFWQNGTRKCLVEDLSSYVVLSWTLYSTVHSLGLVD